MKRYKSEYFSGLPFHPWVPISCGKCRYKSLHDSHHEFVRVFTGQYEVNERHDDQDVTHECPNDGAHKHGHAADGLDGVLQVDDPSGDHGGDANGEQPAITDTVKPTEHMT